VRLGARRRENGDRDALAADPVRHEPQRVERGGNGYPAVGAGVTVTGTGGEGSGRHQGDGECEGAGSTHVANAALE
jgi:hypothetical protein